MKTHQLEKQQPAPQFTVTYSRLCDGGMQEMSTTVACVREIFPDATIRINRRRPHEDIGIRNPSVDISVQHEGFNTNKDNDNGNDGTASESATASEATGKASKKNTGRKRSGVLWSSDQRHLYEKYPKKRRKSMNNIRKSMKAFKTSLETTAVTTTTTTSDAFPSSTSKLRTTAEVLSTSPSSSPLSTMVSMSVSTILTEAESASKTAAGHSPPSTSSPTSRGEAKGSSTDPCVTSSSDHDKKNSDGYEDGHFRAGGTTSTVQCSLATATAAVTPTQSEPE